MDAEITKDNVINILRTIFDPEIPVNIWDLGLIYEVDQSDHTVKIRMTLTAMGCPIGPAIAAEIENKLQTIGVEKVKVDFVWSPPWTPDRLTEDGREQLQMMGYPV